MAIINSEKIGLSSVSTFQADWYNVSATYGPWVDLKEMVETLSGEDYSDKEYLDYYLINNIPVGLTVGLIEGGKVVEYWKPVEGQGFVKKTNGGGVLTVSSYSDAVDKATADNIGTIIYVDDADSDDGELFVVTGDGELSAIGDTTEIKQIISDNEKVVSASLNDLNKRIKDLQNLTVSIADNSTDLLGIDDSSKLEAKTGDLFEIKSSDLVNGKVTDVLGIAEVGNVYNYINQVKTYLEGLITAKKNGIFTVLPKITGGSSYSDVLTVSAASSTGSISYEWFIANDAASEGTSLTTGNSYTVAKTDIGKYIYVIATIAENDTYKKTTAKSNVVGPITKKDATFAFNPSTVTYTYGSQALFTPSTNKKSDDGSFVTYSVDTDNTPTGLFTYDSRAKKVVFNTNGQTGTGVLTATITESSVYNYSPLTASLTINLVAPEQKIYYGFGDKNILNRDGDSEIDDIFEIPVTNVMSTTNKTFHIAKREFTGTFSSWYVLVPKNSNVTIMENGQTDVTSMYKISDMLCVDEYNREYDIYCAVFKNVYLNDIYSLDVSII